MIRSRYTAAVTDKPWWLAGGIPRNNCTMVYQYQAANNEVSSKYDLANNVYSDIKDVGSSWSYPTGWTNPSRYGLPDYPKFTLKPNSTVSCIVKISNIAANESLTTYVFSIRYGGRYAYLKINTDGTLFMVNCNGFSFGSATDGIYAFGGLDFYKNGVYFNSASADTYQTFSQLAIGTGYATSATRMSGNLHALATYDIGLSAHQVAALTAAMNAL